MKAEHLTVYTSPQVFSTLAAYSQAENRRCVLDGHGLILDHLRFRPADIDIDWVDQQDDRAAAAWLDNDPGRLRELAQIGWRTIWYNPSGAISPDRMPAQDGEIVSLDDLADIPKVLTKPTLKTCLEWIDAWRLPVNIRSHVQLVARLAYGLGVMLRNQGQQVDPILAHRGGLLHDLDKLHTLDGAQRHGVQAADFLLRQGHPDLAAIVRGHILGSVMEDQTDLSSWEARLVFFCDKLVEQDQIVPFDLRIKALKDRYPDFRNVMQQAEPYVWALNDQLCSILSIPDHENLISILQEL